MSLAAVWTWWREGETGAQEPRGEAGKGQGSCEEGRRGEGGDIREDRLWE